MSDNNIANDRYSRNNLFINPDQQEKIKNAKILFGGVGLGSVIAETALRLGFENFVFLDADEVEISNLNRQNYTLEDVGKPKVDAITQRLQAINPDVKIEYHQVFLDEGNMNSFVDESVSVAVNALDYDTTAPFTFDNACLEYGVPIIHPGNLSWGAMTFVITHDSMKLDEVLKSSEVDTVLSFLWSQIQEQHSHLNLDWFKDIPQKVKSNPQLPLPQMSVGANLVAGQAVTIMCNILDSVAIKTFPKIYFLSTL
ncbi:HesA/MoeB/ThiF family protein [Microscilla marina]|uniref:Dinucleotide-utilizing enzyme n=1 Tax=Microscilla marina ATCC 23134 TaxID=313606 RepID=A1ZN49_MICM2|nr:ThiF family adenylyltransferase [Microscilla marina]EAY28230.1 dinucleotide-utilizing enzyme [Microscilla marina ATCC 23134]